MPGCAEPAFVYNGMNNWKKALRKCGKFSSHGR